MNTESVQPSPEGEGPQRTAEEQPQTSNDSPSDSADQRQQADQQPAHDWPGKADARSLLNVVLAPGDVLELRALGVRGVRGQGVVSGYFNDPEKLLAAAAELDGRARGIYVTLNPVLPELLARAANHAVAGPERTTSDNEIVRRRLLLIDVDPVRAAGISATEGEKQQSFLLLRNIRQFLDDEGFPAALKGDSGNGGHLIYAIDLAADDGGLISRVLQALAFLFDTKEVKVDQTVFNPARISKLYGTLVQKGDSTPDRPHRRARIFEAPAPLQIVSRELLERVAARARSYGAPPKDSPKGTALDLDAYLSKHGVAVVRSGPWQNGQRWIFEVCPFNPDHTNLSAYVVQFSNGALAAGCHHNSCSTKSWHDLRDLLEPGWRQQSGPSVSSDSAQGGENDGDWAEPQQLPSGLPPVQAFDPRLLPDSLRAWIEDIADRVQCPIDFPAAAAMVVLATVVGRNIAMLPKREDDWIVIVNLWGLVIGRPGILKTPAIREPLKALEALEKEASDKFKADMKEYLAKKKLWDIQQKKKLSASVEECEGTGEDPLNVIRKTLDAEPKPPIRHRYLTNDSTVEKLGEILSENTNGVLVFRDELIGLFRSLDKEGQENARAFYLEAWNGTGRFTYDRIGRGTIDIETAIVSVFGSIQPGPFSQYLQAAVREGKGDDGLMQRFQVAVYPDISKEWVNIDRWPDSEARNRAHEVVKRLSKIGAGEVGAGLVLRESGAIACLRFSDLAQEHFDQWRANLERRARSGEEHPAIESHLAKYRSLIPSLALIIHLADSGVGPVGLEPLEKAIGWGEYLESHARRIYSVAVNPALPAARAIASKILSGALKEHFSLRDVYRPCWTGLARREDAEAGVEILLDLDWLVEIKEKTAGSPKTSYLVNPRVHDLPKEDTDKADKGASDSAVSDKDEGSSESAGSDGGKA